MLLKFFCRSPISAPLTSSSRNFTALSDSGSIEGTIFRTAFRALQFFNYSFEFNAANVVSPEESAGAHPVQGWHQFLTIGARLVIQPHIAGFRYNHEQRFGFREFPPFFWRNPVINVQFNSGFQHISEFYKILWNFNSPHRVVFCAPYPPILSKSSRPTRRVVNGHNRNSTCRNDIVPQSRICTPNRSSRCIRGTGFLSDLLWAFVTHLITYTQSNYLKPPTNQPFGDAT